MIAQRWLKDSFCDVFAQNLREAFHMSRMVKRKSYGRVICISSRGSSRSAAAAFESSMSQPMNGRGAIVRRSEDVLKVRIRGQIGHRVKCT